jgi:hypothetical protein
LIQSFSFINEKMNHSRKTIRKNIQENKKIGDNDNEACGGSSSIEGATAEEQNDGDTNISHGGTTTIDHRRQRATATKPLSLVVGRRPCFHSGMPSVSKAGTTEHILTDESACSPETKRNALFSSRIGTTKIVEAQAEFPPPQAQSEET